MEEKKNRLAGCIIIFFVIIVLFIGIIALYNFLGSRVYQQAQSAYDSQDWENANNLYGRYTKIYGLSIPFRSKEAKEYQEITSLLMESQQMEEQGDYENLLSTYDSIQTNYSDQYKELDLDQNEFEGYFKWAEKLYQNGEFENADEVYAKIRSTYAHNDNFDPEKVMDETLPQLYLDWAAALRENHEYEHALDKYNYITETYPDNTASRKVGMEIQNTYLEWAEYLAAEEEYELAFTQLETIQNTWPLTKISDISSDMYVETGLKYASAYHENMEYNAEIETLEKIANHVPGANSIDQVQAQLSLAYESYAEQCLENKKYFDAVTYFNKYRDTIEDESKIADIDDKIYNANEAMLFDTGSDGQQMIEQISQAICMGQSELPVITTMIPEEASKVVICGETTYDITPTFLANSPGEIKYIIEFSNASRELETCPYEGFYDLIRKQRYVTITVYNVQTGLREYQENIYGFEPEACGPTHDFYNSNETIYGPFVELNQIDTWISEKLKPY